MVDALGFFSVQYISWGTFVHHYTDRVPYCTSEGGSNLLLISQLAAIFVVDALRPWCWTIPQQSTSVRPLASSCHLLLLKVSSHGENGDIRIKRERKRLCLIYCHLYFSGLACGGLRTTAKALSCCGMVQPWLFSFFARNKSTQQYRIMCDLIGWLAENARCG
jgi:hypothetical protein